MSRAQPRERAAVAPAIESAPIERSGAPHRVKRRIAIAHVAGGTRGEARSDGGRPRTIVSCAAVRASVLIASALLALLTLPTPGAAQEEPAHDEVAQDGDATLDRLAALASDLRSDDASTRRAAYDALTTLDEEMLPAIRARIAALRRHRLEPDVARDVFNRIRRAAGSLRADDDTDMAPGALVVLSEERSDRVMRMIEPLLLWRALERLGTFEAGRAMYPLIGIDGDVWKWEARRVVHRMGPRIMAAAIAGRSDSDRWVRHWASETMRALGADEPGLAVQGLAPDVLADVLRAYAMLHMQSAMRVIVSYVDSERRSVRRAARWAIEQYAGNAIWILRTEYRNQTGEAAPETWGWRRVADALYAHADAQRMEPVRMAREAGIAARERGDLEEMKARFDDVLARAPDVEDAGPIAEGYAALARARLDAGRLDEAATAYRRALRLAPEHDAARRWRGELTFVDAQRHLAAGALDEAAYRRVLELAPEHEGARAVLAAITPAPPASHDSRTPWAIFAGSLFALLGIALLVRGRAAPPVDPLEATLAAPTLDELDATLADSTLPG